LARHRGLPLFFFQAAFLGWARLSSENAEGHSRLRRSLKACTTEGVIAELVSACAGTSVLTGWALYLGCGPSLTGLLGSLPFLCQFVQFPAAWLSSRFGYRRLAILSVLASRLVYVALVPLPFLSFAAPVKQFVLLSVAAVSALLAVIGNNAWTAWMSDLVPPKLRGRYFGRRTALCALGSIGISLLSGYWLDVATHRGFVGAALAALAVVACLAGLGAAHFMSKQHQPNVEVAELPLDLAAPLLPMRDPDGQKFLTYQFAWNLAVGLSASYFTLHMLTNLKMGFGLVAAYNAGVAATKILTAPLWGRAVDRFGPRSVLSVCSFGICIIPSLWLFVSSDRLWPLCFELVLSGVLWGGHGLANFSLPFSLSPRRGRAYYLAAFSTAAGLAFAAGTALSASLLLQIPSTLHLKGHTLMGLEVLFLLSSAARFGAAFLSLKVPDEQAKPMPSVFDLATKLGRASLRFARFNERP
jgi:MFS family permease